MSKNELTNKQLEFIESQLLKSMKAIDEALALMYGFDALHKDADVLLDLKKKLKTVLNRNYDACARRRNQADEETLNTSE